MYKIRKAKMLNGSKSNSTMNVNIFNSEGYMMIKMQYLNMKMNTIVIDQT